MKINFNFSTDYTVEIHDHDIVRALAAYCAENNVTPDVALEELDGNIGGFDLSDNAEPWHIVALNDLEVNAVMLTEKEAAIFDEEEERVYNKQAVDKDPFKVDGQISLFD